MNINKVIFYSALITFISLGSIENMLDAYYAANELVLPHWYAVALGYTLYLPTILLLTALASGYWKGVKVMCLTLCAMAVMLHSGIFVSSVWIDSGMLLVWAGLAHMFTTDRKQVFQH